MRASTNSSGSAAIPPSPSSRLRDATTSALLRWLFSTVTYTCHHCRARQRISLRRIHLFERFHHLEHGEAMLMLCPHCQNGLQTPSDYRTHTGHIVTVGPNNPPNNAFIHALY
jgi:hypothetical protein